MSAREALQEALEILNASEPEYEAAPINDAVCGAIDGIRAAIAEIDKYEDAPMCNECAEKILDDKPHVCAL